MIELYGTPTPSAHTIAIMLEEMKWNYSVFPVNKEEGHHLDFEFLNATPKNMFPLILDHEGPKSQPYVIFETSAILLYLAEKSNSTLLPKEQDARFNVIQWLLFENAKIGPTLSNAKHFLFYAQESTPYTLKRFTTEAKRLFKVLEDQLAENDYIAGSEYSIADIAAYPWLKEYERFGIANEEIPATVSWLDKLCARDAIKKSSHVLTNLK